MKCFHIGCSKSPRFAAKINIPLEGMPVMYSKPFGVLTNIGVCPYHTQALEVEEFLNENFIKIVELANKGQKLKPDFSRAFISMVKLNSEEYRQFDQIRKNDTLLENQTKGEDHVQCQEESQNEPKQASAKESC